MMTCDENPCCVRGLGEERSAYSKLPEEKRQAIRTFQREKYHGPGGKMRKRKQYLKALQIGLIARPFARTLERNGILWCDGEWRLSDDAV